MTKTYAEICAEDRRLVMLRLLSDSPAREANHYVIQSALEIVGHRVSRDVVLGDLAWLEEQGLARTDALEGLTVAGLTSRGEDVAAGRSRVPGVKRPAPGE